MQLLTFCDTWSTQLIGTAMGTPCACIYATIFFSWFERTIILPKYHQHILLYKRQIDDIIGIWVPSTTSKLTYKDFTNNLNRVSNLHWESNHLQTSVNFLDLTISISNSNSFSLKNYQKKEKLFLYIPPQSAHPPRMSLTYNLLRTYFIQNTHTQDFKKFVHHFYHCLLARGYSPTTFCILPSENYF